ncbi:hypothetical protein P879_09595 [Paragonimus westermani]|uniref:UHRF1-binding protein 1-like n=1 Tax=Paragonimus westermani TaxID=34504 RepID=A0A8T0D5L6_9TREM|nr:hypothetical protein P879_09595 [Paragonimus westermani]
MFSLIKNQILKPFLQFTKNLSADQINLSLVKGEGHLQSLELNEVTIMDLLDLPTWLYLRRAQCSSISFKIRWTKLDTHPVYVVIDRVDVEVEALEHPRSETDSGIASYRTGSGKYRLADKVVDGASVLINSVFIHFYAQAFQASVELSRVSLASKTPTWQSGSLKLTSLILPSADAVLIFKELTWDSLRIVADGLLAELNGIPVKLITNAGRIRLTLKKCLSDSTLISSRSQFFLEDLLWVLTLSQLEAAIVFLRSLKHVVWLAAEQSKQYAASRAKRQTMSWKNVHNTSEIPIARPRRLQNKNSSTAVTRFFNRYDVVETSYHLYVYRTEVHFCDEVPAGVDMAATPNGYIKVHFYGFEIDWYPYHLDVLPRPRWRGGHDFREARDRWLSSLDPVHVPYGCGRPVVPVAGTSVHADCETPVLNNLNLSVIQSIIIMRIADLDISLVSFPNMSSGGDDAKTAKIAASHFSEELPLSTGLFIGSDKKLHCLPEQTKLLTVEFRNTYRSRSAVLEHFANTEPLPCIVFAQLKPVYLRFDADTVIWLNAFLLTLHLNLDSSGKKL